MIKIISLIRPDHAFKYSIEIQNSKLKIIVFNIVIDYKGEIFIANVYKNFKKDEYKRFYAGYFTLHLRTKNDQGAKSMRELFEIFLSSFDSG